METPIRTILIVDDSPEDRFKFRSNLEKTQYKYVFFEADTGARALELCRSEKFDCILLNVRLPDMNGLEVLHSIEREYGAKASPVVALSDTESIEDVVLMLKEGAHDYLVKSKINWIELGRAIDYAIEKVDLYRQKRRNETEVYRLASIVESSEDAIISKDFSGTILSWNKGAEMMFGYTAEEVIGQSITILFPPELLSEEEGIIARIKRGENLQHYETVRRRKDGSDFEISLTVSPIKNDQGKIIGISKIARDVTGQKQAVRRLRESETNFRALAEATTQAVWESSESGRSEFLSQWWNDLTGQELGDKQNWLDVLHPDDREQARAAWEFALENKTLFDAQYRIKNRSGEYQHFDVRGVPVFNEDGSFRQWIGTFQNVSERKLAQEKLHESDERMRLATKATGVGIWEWNVITNKIRWDDQMFRIYGIAPTEDGYVQYSNWSEIVVPEDLPEQEAILQDTVRRVGHSSREFRIRRADNLEYRDIQSVETVRTNCEGKAEWVVGTNLDITERKRSEEIIKDNEKLLRRVLDNLFSFVGIISTDGTLIEANRAPLEAARVKPDEVFGKKVWETIWVNHSLQTQLQMREACAKAAQGEIIRHDLDLQVFGGNIITVDFMIAPMRDDAGNITHLIASAVDITDRKRAETTSRESEKRYRTLFDSIDEGFGLIEVFFDENEKATDYRFVEINPAFEQLTGIDAEAALSEKSVRRLIPDLEEKWFEIYGKVALTGEPIRFTEKSEAMNRWFDVYAFRVGEPEQRRIAVVFNNVTERKRAEEDLRESEERFRHIADAAPVLIWMADTTKDCVWFNKAWLDFTGRTIEQEHGSGWAEGVHPDDLERCWEVYSSSFDARQNFSMEYQLRGHDGEYHWLYDNGVPSFTANGEFLGYIGSCVDISELKRAESDLRFEKERFEKIVSASPSLIHSLRKSPDGSISYPYVSPAVKDIYGFIPNEIEKNGKVILDRIHPDDATTINNSLTRSVLTMSVWRYLFRYQHPSKREIWIEGSSAPILEPDGSVVWHGILDDVTVRKLNEEAVNQLNESLEQKVAERTAELNAVNKELEAFSYSVSHDLRAPLRAMDGFSLALLEDYGDKFDEAGKNYLNRVRNASKQMARLIDDMLLLARVTREDMVKTQVNLSEVAKSVADKLIENEPRENIVFEIEKGVEVYGDERLLRIAIENLLGNAYKFTSKCEGAKIVFGQYENGNGTEYFVKDNGAGFDMAYANKLFGAFQRLHTATEFAGTGIGLATVQRVIRRHGGHIRAEGKVGEGASFYFTL